MNRNPHTTLQQLKLDFIIAGVMKCGTTSLGQYLGLHPNIAIPPWEVSYFNKQERYQQGPDYYESFVNRYADEQTLVRGEKTPYSYNKSLTAKIQAYHSGLKFIFIFRNPVDRAWSNYVHDLWTQQEWRSFEYCLNHEADRQLLHQYLSKGKYIEQIQDYLEYFDRSQFHFVILEEFLSNRQVELNKIFRFLEVPGDSYDFTQEVHSKKSYHPRYHPGLLHACQSLFGKNNRLWNLLWKLNFDNPPKRYMKPRTRQRLQSYYAPYNQQLEQFLHKKLDLWQ